MIEMYLETAEGYILLIILALVVIKTIAFFTMGSKKLTYKNYLYLSDNNLRNTKDPIKKRKKNIQNFLSIAIFILLLLFVFIIFIGKVFQPPPPSDL